MTMRSASITEIMNKKQPDGIDKLGKPYRVLLVDDSSTIRKLAAQMLRSEAFEVCGEAANGEEAVAMYQELKPDAVTMDVNMPVVDGVESLRRLLTYDTDARVVMVTSEGHRDLVIEAIKQGARGYVVKPFQKANLCSKVKKAIEGE